jgi:serine phosphatase RsbU (regulator of sigma subunit)
VTAIGLAIGFLTSPGESTRSQVTSMLVSALTGVAILACARTLTALHWPRIAASTSARQTAAIIAIFLASGVFAWGVQLAAQVWIVRNPPAQRHALSNLGLTASLALALGFAFYTFERIRTRLEQSVARLKEVEFAEKELLLARELQGRLLPPHEMRGEGYRMAARNLPALIVAGDFYDLFRLGGGAVGVVVADVAGKGMAAALIMASVKAMLPLLAAERGAAETLRELNRHLAGELARREFVALAFARYDAKAGKLALANAGLPDPYLVRRSADPHPLQVPGPRLPLGVRRDVDYQELEIPLAGGDRLLLLTDGLAEAQVADGEPLGYAGFAALLQAEPWTAEPLPWLDGLLARLRRATAPALADDWTALVLQAEPAASAGG